MPSAISKSSSETCSLPNLSSACNPTSIITNCFVTKNDASSQSAPNLCIAPLPISSSISNFSLEPPTIDALSYVSDVFDNIFALQVSAPTPIHKSIRILMIKKLLLDHASQELLFHSISNFDELYNFIIDLFQRTQLLT